MARNLATLPILGGLIAALAIGAEAMGVRLIERIATSLCISLVLVLGLQVFMGNSGILSFAHIGFMGVGAYTSAVLTIPAQMKGMALPDLYPFLSRVQLSPYIGILAGGLVAAAVAAAVAYPLMRLSDAAAVITSFALLVVLHNIMTNWSVMTNGPRTLFGLLQPRGRSSSRLGPLDRRAAGATGADQLVERPFVPALHDPLALAAHLLEAVVQLHGRPSRGNTEGCSAAQSASISPYGALSACATLIRPRRVAQYPRAAHRPPTRDFPGRRRRWTIHCRPFRQRITRRSAPKRRMTSA